MEENKKEVKAPKEGTKKLSYEALENAARQISVQADAFYKENIELKQQISALNLSNLYTELNFRFKVLEFAGFFSDEFVDLCVEVIENAMTPDNKEEKEEEEEEKEKEETTEE